MDRNHLVKFVASIVAKRERAKSQKVLVISDKKIEGVTPREREIYQQEYSTIRAMPSSVFAARIVTELIAKPRLPAEMTQIIGDAIDALKAEYRRLDEIEEIFCKQCDRTTTHRVERLNGMNPETSDLILRCTHCDKVVL